MARSTTAAISETSSLLQDLAAQMGLDEDLGELPVTPAEHAAVTLCLVPLPAMVAMAGEDAIPPALTAIDPKLTLGDVDAACAKIEDLAIMMLSQVRATRHEVASAIAGASERTLAAKAYGEGALGALDLLKSLGPLDEEEVENNRRLLRSVTCAKPAKARRT